MQWVLWDEQENKPTSVLRNLPGNVADKTPEERAALGYHELRIIYPEDYIPRFRDLLGSSVFTMREDRVVTQTFPDADFTVSSVKRSIGAQVERGAQDALSQTDWYVIRKIETGVEVPPDVTRLRQNIRAHVDWVKADVMKKSPREVVEYFWVFPTDVRQKMVNGSPVIYDNSKEPKVITTPPPPMFSPPPATTDGPIPFLVTDTGLPAEEDPNNLQSGEMTYVAAGPRVLNESVPDEDQGPLPAPPLDLDNLPPGYIVIKRVGEENA